MTSHNRQAHLHSLPSMSFKYGQNLTFKQTVCLIQDQVLQLAQTEGGVILYVVSQSARSSNDDVRSPVQVLTLSDGVPAPSHHHHPQTHGLAQYSEGVADLKSKFSCWSEDEAVDAVGVSRERLQDRNNECKGFSLASLGNAQTISSCQDGWDTILLDRSWLRDSEGRKLVS